MNWFYISFANPKFQGAMIVQGHNLKDAVNNAILLGANRDWHAFGANITQLGAALPDASYLNRLLSREDVEGMEMGGEKGGTMVNVCDDCAGHGPLEMKARVQ